MLWTLWANHEMMSMSDMIIKRLDAGLIRRDERTHYVGRKTNAFYAVRPFHAGVGPLSMPMG